MRVQGPSRSRLSSIRRAKAMIPVFVALAVVTLFIRHVHRDAPFAINDVKEKDRTWLESMLFVGLNRIESAGWQVPWDEREDRPFHRKDKQSQ